MAQYDTEKTYFSTTEVGKILHISREAVLKKIKTGRLSAQKVGRNYIISKDDLEAILGNSVSPVQREEIERIVKKAVEKYHDTFRKLGEE
jgi:excisionase family DNA binding protein